MTFDKSKSIYLEFYRGIAAFGVAICHYLAAHGSAGSEFSAVIFVEMFFPLSGFILAPQVLRIYQDRGSFKIFLMRRWIRTIPLYILGLICVGFMTFNLSSPQFKQYFLFYHFLSTGYSINNFYPVSWSLAVEEYYYILFPLFVFALPVGNLKSKTLAFIALGFGIKVGMSYFVPHAFLRIATYSRIDAIAIGFLFYLMMDRCNIRHLYLALPLFIGAALAHYQRHNSAWAIAFIYSANIFFGLACALLYRREQRLPPFNVWFRRLATLIGAQSYSVYVFHIFVLGICMKAGLGILYYLFLVMIVSHFLHVYFEYPLMKMRPKYRNTQDAPMPVWKVKYENS
ncbi:MAG: acyltransferase [Nitrospirota bacterium]